MAKQRTYNTSPDANLISGARFASKGYVSSSGSEAVLSGAQVTDSYQQQVAARKQASDATMGQFIESMPTNVDLDKVPVSMRDTTNKYLVGLKDEFFENAKIASREGASSPLYAEAVSNMNRITMAFKNLNQDFEKLKEMKYNYINDYDKGFVSEGSRPEAVEFMTNLTTDQVPLGISESGRLTFGEGATLDDAPKYATKDFETAKSLIDLNSTLYNAGQPMDKGKEGVVRMQIRNALSKGGRDAVLSMATDDYIMPGGLGIQDQDLLYNPERTKELSQFVEDQYVAMLSQTANDGYKALMAKENRADNRAIARSLSLAKKKQAAGLTTEPELTAAQRRAIDAQDRVQVGAKHMSDVMKGNVASLNGITYNGSKVIGASWVGANGSGAAEALRKAGFGKSDINNLEADPDNIILITDDDYFVVNPFDETINKTLNEAIITSKFGNDATTDDAINTIENSKPVLPSINVGPNQEEQSAPIPYLTGI